MTRTKQSDISQKKSAKRHAHLVGIKGVAMAALAVYLSEAGYTVTGSDVPEHFPTQDELETKGIRVEAGFDASRVQGVNKPDVLYYTGAHGGRDNVEVVAAKNAGVPVYPHGQALGNIMENSRAIVVAGSHGKTTTSAMIAALLTHAKFRPSYAIGCGSIGGLGAAGHKGESDWFIAEGDEYITDPTHDATPRFLWLTPEILVVTNIDYDHPDAYADLRKVQDAFVTLQQKSGVTIYNADDKNSVVLMGSGKVISYGFSPNAEYRITRVADGRERMFFSLEERGVSLGEFTLKVPGKHNVLNATAAMIAAHIAGVSWDVLRESLLTFTGTKRRFERLGSENGVMWYDDYAHHPTEIAATLKAARMWYPDSRIIAVFQPHTYSRTKSLLGEFGRAFADCDTVLLTDIYASAREHDTLGINGNTLVLETAKNHRDVHFVKDKNAIVEKLKALIKPGDVVVFMGAGDIYNWEGEIIEAVTKG